MHRRLALNELKSVLQCLKVKKERKITGFYIKATSAERVVLHRPGADWTKQ